MNKDKMQHLCLSAIFVLTSFIQINAADILSGRVYQGDSGTEPPAATALSGVTVTLFGSNNKDNTGIQIGTTTTNSDGYYGLTATIGYEYYTLVETDPSGYHSVGATSVDGTVLTYNQIRISTENAPLANQTLTGNKFWDQPDTPANHPPASDANGPYTGMVGQSIMLNGSGSYDPDPGDSIVSYEWDLDNDGQYDDDTGVTVQHTWNSAYNGNIGLRVTDSYGETDTDQSSVNISKGEPEIEIRGNGISISNGDNTPSIADWTDMGSLEINTGAITKTFYIHNSGSDTLILTGIELYPDTYYQSGSIAASFGIIPDLMKVAPGSSVSLGVVLFPYQTGIWGTTLTIKNNDSDENPFTFYVQGIGTESTVSLYDYGDAPDPTYPTLLANNGAQHIIKPGFYLGAGVDAESDGLPSAFADGDNNQGYNDEDGVSISPFIAPGQAVPVTIVASDSGVINAWLDFNIDGDWADAGEQFITAQPVVPGINLFTLNVPGGSVSGLTYARIRFSSIRQLSYNGPAPDGEVEDYVLEIVEGDDGSVVIIKEASPEDNTTFWFCTQLGTGFFNLYCDFLQDPLKDKMTILNPDKVLNVAESPVPGWTLTDIMVTGDADNGSAINIADGNIDLDYDAGEHIVITFKNKKSDHADPFDFGDAPDPAYPTLLASNGARHKISPTLYLGSGIDPETEGQPSPMADGDNQNILFPGTTFPPGDEDGVLFPSVITAGQSIPVQVTSSGTGVLNAWLDFNSDGDWADAGEHMIPALPVSPGINTFIINVPGSVQAGQSYARFRLSSVREISYDGLAPDGEVEDYAVAILQGDGGSITIIKDALPKDDTPFWITTVFGVNGGAGPFRDPSSNTSILSNGPLGTYSLGESIPAGWTLTDIAVTGDSDHGSAIDVGNASVQIDLDANEKITVTFKNTKTGGHDDYDFGDAPSPFPTKLADLGAYHLVDTTFRFGNFIDAEEDGLPDPKAQGDDMDHLDDESEMIYIPGFLYFLNSTLNLAPNNMVKILFAVDWERDGSWNNNYYFFTITHQSPFTLVVDLSAMKMAVNLPPGTYNARWRIYQDTSYIPIPTGYGGVGEVEDCQFVVTGDESVEYDYGDAPLPYPTQLQAPPFNSYGGRHPIVPGIHLGQRVDPEADGQPEPNAKGDDNDGSDDEDGVVFTTNLIPGQLVSIDVTASAEGYLNAYIDLNQDQDWTDPNEQIFFEEPITAGINGLTFTLPVNAKSGGTFARFRFSTQKLYLSLPQQNVFLARDGEVEDYEIFIEERGDGPPVKWKQPPLMTGDPDYPFAPCFKGWDEYSVLKERIIADDWFCNDPRPVTDIHWWGSYMDWEGVEAPEPAPYEFHIGVWTDVPANENLPWRHPGTLVWEWRVPREMLNERPVGDDFVPERMEKPDTCFQYDFFIPEDQWFFQEGDSTLYWLSIAAVYDVLPDAFVWGWKTREHYFRSDAVRIIEPKEFAIGAIVEFAEPIEEMWDVAFVLTTNEHSTEFDFGDAPDSRYPTLFAQNGAHHIFTPDLFLGTGVDPEVDGQPEPGSMGDDQDGNDDEDGILFLSKLEPGSPVRVEVNASASGFLNAWMDFNNNGSWAEADEQIFIDRALVPGTNVLTFTMPANSFEAITFSRFRFSSEAHIPFFGLAIDGEVEDYYVDVNPVGADEIKELDLTEFNLEQNFPNPFNTTTEILYEIPREVFVRLALYNLSGQEIAILVNEQKSPGRYIVKWNGMDSQGQEAAEGIYFYRIEAGSFKGIGKLLRLKE